MTTLREAVARAMYAADIVDGMFEDQQGRDLPSPPWDSAIGKTWQPRFHAMADAAIAAVLEEMMENPSEGMGAAGLDVLEDGQSWLAALRVHRAIVAQFRKEALNGH